jgi:hypothetical protein
MGALSKLPATNILDFMMGKWSEVQDGNFETSHYRAAREPTHNNNAGLPAHAHACPRPFSLAHPHTQPPTPKADNRG